MVEAAAETIISLLVNNFALSSKCFIASLSYNLLYSLA